MPRQARDAEAMVRVAAALRTLRESAGFSVSGMAAICGVNRKTWYRREDLGIVPPPKDLAAFARSVDPGCPLRAKATVLQAAGFLTDREADAMLTASRVLMERPKRGRSHQVKSKGLHDQAKR